MLHCCIETHYIADVQMEFEKKIESSLDFMKKQNYLFINGLVGKKQFDLVFS